MKTLLVIVGPTGVGKTELSIGLAREFGSPILNADSRQIYREIPIGTAAPTAEEQALVKHYFVGTHSLHEDYNAGQYERDALALLDELFQASDTVVMSGGSMMYISAVCRGLDEMPEVPAAVREKWQQAYRDNGIEWLAEQVRQADPVYYEEVDRQNPQRLIHALEITEAGGRPFSTFRTHGRKERPFRILKIGLTRPREELYERINRRVDEMIRMGLRSEAEATLPFRSNNSLQTVGYKEMFNLIDGIWTEEEAIRMIKQNSRHYAKRQLTWYRADESVHWIDLSQTSTAEAIAQVRQLLDTLNNE